jgi:hypothetical protein
MGLTFGGRVKRNKIHFYIFLATSLCGECVAKHYNLAQCIPPINSKMSETEIQGGYLDA